MRNYEITYMDEKCTVLNTVYMAAPRLTTIMGVALDELKGDESLSSGTAQISIMLSEEQEVSESAAHEAPQHNA